MTQTQHESVAHHFYLDSLKLGYAQLTTHPDSAILLGHRIERWAVTNDDSVIQMNAHALMAEAAQQLGRFDTSTEYYLSAIAIARVLDLPNKLYFTTVWVRIFTISVISKKRQNIFNKQQIINWPKEIRNITR